MPNPTYTVGIVCTGNTCRSPITAAWARHFLDHGRTVPTTIWTAGLSLGDSSVVGSEALVAAREMGLPEATLAALAAYHARPLAEESSPTNLLVWISDPEKVNAVYEQGHTRAEHMLKTATLLGAALMVVPEADNAWRVKQSLHASDEEKLQAYRVQAESLRAWADVVARIVPGISP